MKKTMILTLALFVAGIVTAQETPYTTTPVNAKVSKVTSVTSGGNIEVSSTASNTRVEMYLQPNGRPGSVSKEELKERLDKYYEVNVGVEGDELKAIAKRKDMKWSNKTSLSISFKIFINKDVSTDLTTSGGNISLNTLNGKQVVTTSGGNIEIAAMTGKLNGTTSGGNIIIADSHDELKLVTSGGDIRAKDCSGKIELTTSGGNVHLASLDGDVKANTSGGNVEAENIKGGLDTHTSGGNIALTDLSCKVNASTSGGDIKAVIKEPGEEISIANSGGRIDLQLPAGKGYDLNVSGDNVHASSLSNFDGNVEKDEIKGKLNGGGSKVKVRGNGGSVYLTVK